MGLDDKLARGPVEAEVPMDGPEAPAPPKPPPPPLPSLPVDLDLDAVPPHWINPPESWKSYTAEWRTAWHQAHRHNAGLPLRDQTPTYDDGGGRFPWAAQSDSFRAICWRNYRARRLGASR